MIALYQICDNDYDFDDDQYDDGDDEDDNVYRCSVSSRRFLLCLRRLDPPPVTSSAPDRSLTVDTQVKFKPKPIQVKMFEFCPNNEKTNPL